MKANGKPATNGHSHPLPRRTLLAGLAGRLRVGELVLDLRARKWWPWKTLTVVAYHRINYPDAIAPLDPDLIDATPEVFEAHMRFFQPRFQCVSVQDVIDAADGRAPLPPNPLLITFDDGYLDNYKYALPILERTGMRAVFFVATDYMRRRKLFWWDRIWITMHEAEVDEIAIDYPHAERLPVRTEAERAAAAQRANRIIKDTFALDVDRFLDGLTRAARVAWSAEREAALADQSIMGWDEVEALHRAGMQVQSHTRSHRVIETLPEHELAGELAGARAELEQRLGSDVRCIAYPVGRSIAHKGHIRRALAAAGYRLGFTSHSGVNTVAASDLFDLRRLMIDRTFSQDIVRGFAALPWLAEAPRKRQPS